ncbi:MAG: cytochrome c5 family protein [Gammaproteobacteria bacterium]
MSQSAHNLFYRTVVATGLSTLLTLAAVSAPATASAQDTQTQSVEDTIRPVGRVRVAGTAEASPAASAAAASTPAAAPTPAETSDGKRIYDASCMACHATGAAGAPKLGDQAAWGPRIAQGLDTLVDHSINGLRAMPPRGACGSCSDADLQAAVEYMVDGSQ